MRIGFLFVPSRQLRSGYFFFGHVRNIFLYSLVFLILCPRAVAESPDNSDFRRFWKAPPVVLANLVYAGYSETPRLSAVQNELWGHVAAIRIYDPVDPAHTGKVNLWDAGAVLNRMAPSDRRIYFPRMAITHEESVRIAIGNGTSRLFSGTLSHPILAGTVIITDRHETFHDEHLCRLTGNLGGKGTINRFTGEYRVTFSEPPADGVPVTCQYVHYSTGSDLLSFESGNLDNNVLGLGERYPLPGGVTQDVDGNGIVDKQDGYFLVQWVRGYRDGFGVKKEWLLGSVSQCVPAVVTSPGRPPWYYGTAIRDKDRESFDRFVDRWKQRRSVLYVGAGDGMIHALDAGRFRWGDNPETVVVEKRGYFEWMDPAADFSLRQWWDDLLVSHPRPSFHFGWRSSGAGAKAPDYGTGRELWAFVPPDLLPRLKNNFSGSQDCASLDASPAIADVNIHGRWHTVLISGEGNGGDTVFCLDITDPESPRFLWEFADPVLIRRHSAPAVGRIGCTALDGVTRWVVFFVSGDRTDEARDPSVFMIDIADGSVVKRIFLHAGIDDNGDGVDDGKGGVPCSQPALIDSDGNGFMDRLYVGTDKGFMFKAVIPDDPERPGNGIRSCVLNTDFDYHDGRNLRSVPGDRRRQAIYGSPAVVVDNHRNKSGQTVYDIRVFFGTCAGVGEQRPDAVSDRTCRFFAYSDTGGKDECGGGSSVLDWFRELSSGREGVYAPAFASAGSVYFTTAVPAGEDPSLTTGRMYALDMKDGKVIFENAFAGTLSGPVVEDEHVFFNSVSGGGGVPVILGSDVYNNDVVKTPDAPPGIRSWKEIW